MGNLNNSFNIIIPLRKDINNHQLIGIASTTSVDRDEERMSDKALQMMTEDIKRTGVNLFGNHEHNWENTLGVIQDADLVDKQVEVKIDLDDATTNPKIPMLLNKLNKGIKLGLSVGGNVVNYKWEYDSELRKKVKVLDEVKIYEVSVVGIPSNADSFLSIPQAIAKSAKIKKSLRAELDDLKREQNELTTSDLQGVVSVIARRFGVDDDDCLEYIYTGDTTVFEIGANKSCPLCYSKMTKQCLICFYKED